MKDNQLKNYLLTSLGLLLLVTMIMVSCKKESMTLTTTEDVNITGYFEKYPEEFSMFSEILDKTGTSSYLAAYGTYTIFAPTNAAVKSWLESKNLQSIGQADVEELKGLVKYHLIEDTISTKSFGDGKIQQLTLYGQYLQTGAKNIEGVSKYTINKEANVLKTNIRVGNGIIHVVDKVLSPAVETLAQKLEKNLDYSIFYQALVETHLIDTLNKPVESKNPQFLTVVAESNSALSNIGVTTLDQLKSKLKSTNPTSPSDSLWLYVAYHIMPGANYLADIATTSSLSTYAPQEIVTAKLKSTKILLNDDEFNGVLEPGVELARDRSDIAASNGVLHSSAASYRIKVRFPTPIFFDLGDQPELKGKAGYRTSGAAKIVIATTSTSSIVSGITFANGSATQSSSYVNAGVNDYYVFRDYVGLSFGTGNNARHKWIEFQTPMIVKGKYRVWLCYRSGNAANLQGTFDFGTPNEQVLANIVVTNNNLGASGVNLSDPNSANLLFAQGYKRYAATPTTENRWVGRLMGTVDVSTTDRHKLRLTMVGGRDGTETSTLDMIQFIPVDMDQLIRLDKDGNKLDKDGNPL